MSETNDERSPGFNKSLTSRLIAVGIFVVVGTAGVAYYLNTCRNAEESPTVASLDSQNAADTETADVAEVGETSSPTLTLKPVTNQRPTGMVKPKSSPSSDSNNSTNSNFSGSFQPTGSGSGSFRQDSNPSQATKSQSRNNKLPPSKSFEMPKVVKPKTGSAFGAKPPISNPSTFNNSLGPTNPTVKPPLQQTKENIANRFQQLKQNTSQFAENAKQKTVQTTNQTLNNTKNALRSFAGSTNQTRSQMADQGADRNHFAANPNTTSKSTTPPISERASFDTSKELKPFTGAPPITTRTNPQPPSSRPPIVSRTAPVRNNITNPQLPTTRNNSISRLQNVSTGTDNLPIAPRVTQNTPGDRKLEGIQAPSVTVEKIAPREIQVNTPADFQLVVKNVGRVAANDVKVFDQIPVGTELVQSVPQPQRGPGGQISWDLDTLNPGQEKRIKLQLKPLTPGEIGSVAQVSFSTMASMRTKVTKPVLSISHETQSKVLIGDTVTLDIAVKNEGDGPANEVVIQEDLPEGLVFSEGFRELEYAIGTLGPGQSRKLRLELKAAKIGNYRNVLVAHAKGGLHTQHAVDLEVIAPSLQATGEGPTRRFLKREATHRFAVRNSGTAPASNVELVCRLPSGLRYKNSNNRGKYDENTHAVYWSLAELNPGLIANVELTTIPLEPGNQDLKFEVVSDLNQSANTICKLNVEHLVDVFFDIDDLVDPIEIGSETTYLMRIINQGSKTATNVQLQVEFPRGIQPTAVEGNINSEIRGQQIAFQPITSMNPADQIEIRIRGKGITAGDHRISVNLIADGREVNVSKQESTRVYSDR